MNACYAIPWTEYERGWGQRPDGTTFCKTKEIAEEISRKAYEGRGDTVADEYTNPGTITLMEVSPALYNKVQEDGSFFLIRGDPMKWAATPEVGTPYAA